MTRTSIDLGNFLLAYFLLGLACQLALATCTAKTSFVHVYNAQLPSRCNSYSILPRWLAASDQNDPLHDQVDVTTPAKPRTERQIRQLVYVMVNDVEELIKTNASAAPEKALDNIQRLERLFEDTGDQAYRSVSKEVFNSLVRAYAKSGIKGHDQLAEETFYEMKEMAENTGDKRLLPDATTACAVIDGYARAGGKAGPLNAERFLFLLMDDAEASMKDGVREEDVLLPTSAAANAVIKSWACRNTREGALRAKGILERMEIYSASAQGGGKAIHPTTHSYCTVITGLSRGVGGIEAAERGEEMLEKLNTMADEANRAQGNEESREDTALAKPNTVLWNSVIDGYARSLHPTAGTRALALLQRMQHLSKNGNKEVAPDSISYRCVINAFANSGHINAAKSAEKVMEMAVKDGIAVDTRMYNTILKAWSSSSLPNNTSRAHEILKSMIDAHVGGDDNVSPDVYSFSTVLNCIAKTSEPGKAQRARDLLTLQVEFWNSSNDDKSRPNSRSYNSVLNACAFSAMATDREDRKQALLIAFQTFNELLSAGYAEADEVSYGTMLKSIANLVPVTSSETRNEMASKLFLKCAESGLVSDFVLKELKRCLTADCLRGFMSKHVDAKRGRKFTRVDSITLSSLPKEWKANVSNNKKKRRVATKRKTTQGQKKKGAKKKTSGDLESNREKASNTSTTVPSVRIVEQSWQSGRDV